MAAGNGGANGGANGALARMAGYVAGVLIVAALLGNYAYTREGRQEMRAEIARVEQAARGERERVEKAARADQTRAYDQLSGEISKLGAKVDRLIELLVEKGR